MRKIIAVFALAMLVVSCNQTKIAYVDVEEVLKEYKGTKEAEKEMNKRSDELKKELDQLAADYQNRVRDYYAKAQKMSNKKRQETEAALTQQQQLLNQRQQLAQQEVQKNGQEKMDEINEDIQDFVADYAKKNGYTYILGTSEQTRAVLYGDSKTDLTDAIIEALNDKYRNQGTETPETKKDSVK